MQIALNLSPYVLNYINSFADMNSSQVVESIVRQYIDASRRTNSMVTDPYVSEKAEKQRVQPRSSKLAPTVKNLKPTK